MARGPNLRSIIPGISGTNRLVDSIERVIMQEWKAESRSLRETREVYRNNIKVDLKQPKRMRLTLRGTLPNIVEQGMGPGGVGTYGSYDIRKFVKFKGKPYVNVPFKHKRDTMSSAASAAAGRLAISRSKPGGGFIYGRKTKKNIGPRMPRGMAPVRSNPTTGQRHSTDFLAGMIRVRPQGTSPRSGSQYMTFRRLSKNGKPWISRGVRPRRFADKIVRRMPTLIGPIMAALFRSRSR